MKTSSSMQRLCAALALAAASTLAGASAHAAPVVWNGDGDGTSWTDGDNWVSDTAPISNDNSDTAVFGSTGTPTAVSIPVGRDVGGIRFETAGWMLGSIDQIKSLYSSSGTTGVSMNTMGAIGEVKSNQTWQVIGADHTLKVDGKLRYYSYDIVLTGGGTLWTTQRLESADFSSPTSTIQTGTLRIDASSPDSASNGDVHIGADTGFLQLLTSNVSSVQGMFGTRIIDDTGMGLQAIYDSGTGYTTVSVVPEPASLGLLGLGGLLLMLRRRRS